MERFKLAAFLLALPVAGLADNPAIATPGLAPGTYRAAGYVTKFDPEGRWATTANGETKPQLAGRYTVDGDLMYFMLADSTCKVRYRVKLTNKGFDLRLIEDGCNGVQQAPDIEFVRVR